MGRGNTGMIFGKFRYGKKIKGGYKKTVKLFAVANSEVMFATANIVKDKFYLNFFRRECSAKETSLAEGELHSLDNPSPPNILTT